MHKLLFSGFMVALLWQHTAVGQQDPGLAVGAKAPAFSLSDQNSKQVTLGSLLKQGPVAVVFHRSAAW